MSFGSVAYSPILQGEPRQQLLTFDQMAALREPISVAVMTGHYFGSEYNRYVDNCTLVGVPLDCTFIPKSSEPLSGDLAEMARSADAVWWHAPNSCTLQVSCRQCVARVLDSNSWWGFLEKRTAALLEMKAVGECCFTVFGVEAFLKFGMGARVGNPI